MWPSRPARTRGAALGLQSMRRLPGARVLMLAAALALTPGCLVLSLHPAYDGESIAWDPGLLGQWQNVEDRAALQIERGEWRSYRIHYVHPIETGDLTGYLTAVGDHRYLDVMPVRGADHGSFLIPVHAVLRVRLSGDRLELTPLSYDWFFDRVRFGRRIPGLDVTLDQKENALIISPRHPGEPARSSPTDALRAWLRSQAPAGPMFGAPATFTRE